MDFINKEPADMDLINIEPADQRGVVFIFCGVMSAALNGIECQIVRVEVDVSDGLPGFSMVGFLAEAVREAQDRVRTALKNIGYKLSPKKITVNLAPADIRKAGSAFDLPIAIAVLTCYGYIPAEASEHLFFAGELSLDGSIYGVRGILGMVMEAKKAGCKACIIPEANIREGAVIDGIEVYGAISLEQVIMHLTTADRMEPVAFNIEEMIHGLSEYNSEDFSEIRGQHHAKRAAEIAAAGMHNLLLSGPPGAGKSMIASRIRTLLPPLDIEEALEVTQIHSVSGLLPESGIITERPFRMPHHTVTAIALTGGGTVPKPGEISLAHHGVLYLDEIAEYQKETLEVLREPMEEGVIHISRNSGQYIFPADFMLVSSRNPCKCGYYPDRSRCRCSENEVKRYLQKISRPLLDRIDLHAETSQIEYGDLTGNAIEEESSQTIRDRVLMAHTIQKERFREYSVSFNAQMSTSMINQFCKLGPWEAEWMEKIYTGKQLTARSYHKMLKVARTIADLDGSEEIGLQHLSEALLYRPRKELM